MTCQKTLFFLVQTNIYKKRLQSTCKLKKFKILKKNFTSLNTSSESRKRTMWVFYFVLEIQIFIERHLRASETRSIARFTHKKNLVSECATLIANILNSINH